MLNLKTSTLTYIQGTRVPEHNAYVESSDDLFSTCRVNSSKKNFPVKKGTYKGKVGTYDVSTTFWNLIL